MKKVLIVLTAVVCLLASCHVGTQYQSIDLELINKSGKNAKEVYFYPENSEYKFPDIISHYEDTAKVGVWKEGRGCIYIMGYVLREYAESYTLELVFEDGTNLVIDGLKFVPDKNGNIPNSIIIRDYSDPTAIIFEYDNGNPEPLQNFKAAREAKETLDGFIGSYPFWNN